MREYDNMNKLKPNPIHFIYGFDLLFKMALYCLLRDREQSNKKE